jgi:Zn-dependent metalloprotease
VLTEQYAYNQTADEASWLIGELLCKDKIQGRALRDMLNPGTAYDDPLIGKDPQGPDMDHYDHTSQDNGGVHINSGIPNRAFALACKQRGGYSWLTIGRIWYIAHTTKVKHNTDFQTYANLTHETAIELYGEESVEEVAVHDGWFAVGITVGATPVPQPTPSPFPNSPCAVELQAILNDSKTIQEITALAQRNPHIRRLLAAFHSALK